MATRNYKNEYKKFQSSTKQKKLRAERNRLRREVNARRKKQGKPPLRRDQHVAHVKGKDGKMRIVIKSSKTNQGSKKDNKGDKKARGKGQTKKQPKRKRS